MEREHRISSSAAQLAPNSSAAQLAPVDKVPTLETGRSEAPCWKRLPDDVAKEFIYNHCPRAGDRRGYIISSHVLLAGHETCDCHRAKVTQKMFWFLPHSDAHHWTYPVHCSKEPALRQQLVNEKPWTSYGFLMDLKPLTSYGALPNLLYI
jgi:hypothetical protein